MQKLLFPIQNAVITAGYKNIAYGRKFGFSHYGEDVVSAVGDTAVLAGGNGKVLVTGKDAILGNVLIVLYPLAFQNQTQKTQDVVLRYFHMDSIAVKVGDVVTPGQPLGKYGRTGRYSTGAHLHIEADMDCRFVAYSATLGKSSNIIKAGTETTMCNPACVLHLQPQIPQRMRCVSSQDRYGGLPFVLPADMPQLLR